MPVGFKSNVTVEKPDDVPVTIKITMSLGDWKRLKSQLTGAYPSWKIADIIYAAVTKISPIVEIVDEDLSYKE